MKTKNYVSRTFYIETTRKFKNLILVKTNPKEKTGIRQE